jgi:hypothetical protein
MNFVYAARSVLRHFPDCRFSIVGAPLFSGANYLLTAGNTAEALARRIRCVLNMDHAALQAVVDRARKRWQEEHTLDVYQQRVGEFLFQAVCN